MQVKWVRNYVTSDPNDSPISEGKVTVAFAYGSGPLSTHTTSNRGVATIDFFTGSASVQNDEAIRKA